MRFPPGHGIGLLGTIFTDILAGLVFIILLIVGVGVLFLLVRFLLVATKAAELYISKNGGAQTDPTSTDATKPDAPTKPVTTPASATPATTKPTPTTTPTKPMTTTSGTTKPTTTTSATTPTTARTRTTKTPPS